MGSLSHLLEKDQKWMWSKECEQAFDEVKSLITSEQVLVHYDPDLPIRVVCDSSAYGLGAVLSHKMPHGLKKPIVFAS